MTWRLLDRRALLRLAALAVASACTAFVPAVAQVAGDAEPPTRLRVGGAVQRPGTWDLAALQALPSSTVTVAGRSWTGVSLWRLLDDAAGLKLDATQKNAALAMAVIATGSDGYRVVFSVGELDPRYGNQPDLIAWSVDGAPLAPRSGFVRLVVPGDGRTSRHVSNLAALDVVVVAVPP